MQARRGKVRGTLPLSLSIGNTGILFKSTQKGIPYMGRFDRYTDAPSMAHIRPIRANMPLTGMELAFAQEVTPAEKAALRNNVISFIERKFGREYLSLLEWPFMLAMYRETLDTEYLKREVKKQQAHFTEQGRTRKRAEKRLNTLRFEFRKFPAILEKLTLDFALALQEAEEEEGRNARYLSGMTEKQAGNAAKKANKQVYDRNRKAKQKADAFTELLGDLIG